MRFDVTHTAVVEQKPVLAPFAHPGAHRLFKNLLDLRHVVRVYFLERTGAAKGLRIAQNFLVGSAVVQPLALRIENGDQIRDVVRNQPEQLFALAQLRFRLFLFQGDLDGRSDSPDVLLEHVIHRPGLHALHGGLLVDRARHDDEWHVRGVLLRQSQGLHAVEVRQTVIGKDDVRRKFNQPLQIIGPGCDMTRVEIDFDPTQFALEQLRVVVHVFQNQNAQAIGHCFKVGVES